jgi:hypothetical protein
MYACVRTNIRTYVRACIHAHTYTHTHTYTHKCDYMGLYVREMLSFNIHVGEKHEKGTKIFTVVVSCIKHKSVYF